MKREIDPKAISVRLVRRMKELDISGADITRATGATSAAVTKWRQGLNAPSRYALPLANLLQTTPEWLLYGIGAHETTNTLKINEFRTAAKMMPYDDNADLAENDEIYFLRFAKNLGYACGDGVLNEEFQEEARFPFFIRSLVKAGVKDFEKAIVGYAEGESNAPTIPHGSAIGIDTGCTRIYHEEIYAITIDGEDKLKQIINMGEGRFMLRSLNPDKVLYPDVILDAETIIESQFVVRGRMFWCSWIKKLK